MSVPFPQLRVRSEYSFRKAFGPLQRCADAAHNAGASAAGLVDGQTWGHVQWDKTARNAGLRPLFGSEVEWRLEDGRRPVSWTLMGQNSRGYYRAMSAIARAPETAAEVLAARGEDVISFAGVALEDPALIDYVDLSPSGPLAVQRALALAKRLRKPLVVTSNNFMPSERDAGAAAAMGVGRRALPMHVMGEKELREHFREIPARQWRQIVNNTREAAERAGSTLQKAPIIHVPNADLRAAALAGRDRRLKLGHLPAWPEEYQQRLEHELEVVLRKDFASYFIVVADLVSWAKERMLVGPGRGSSAGSLLCYCLGITEVDPIPHHLLFERFVDDNRSDLPDIDIDFSDRKRDEVFTYLRDKYGASNVARVGSINTLKPRSALAEVCKRLGVPDKARFDLLNVLIEYSSGDSRYGHSLEDTMTQTDTGRAFERQYPAAMVVREIEGHAWHTGVHAAGVLVCNEPVDEFVVVGADGVAHTDKAGIESLNLLKIDALGLRTLGVIEDADVISADELYALKPDDPAAFAVLNDRKFSGVFQFEGHAQQSVTKNIHVGSFQTMDHITALARPGPLGGGAANKYIDRHAGREAVEFRHPALEPILNDTYGVVLYQEQVMRIVRDIGDFSWSETSAIRKAMSGRKGKEFFDRQGDKFVEGASKHGIVESEAREIWDEICTFGAWGMNRAHTCAYALIGYWVCWMKAHHPLEYAAACLRSAKDDEQTIALLRELHHEGVAYTPFDIDLSREHWSVQDGRLVGGFRNLVGFGPAKARQALERRDAGRLTDKDRERIAAAQVRFADLFPLHTQFGYLFQDPTKAGCRAGSRFTEISELPDGGEVLMIVQLLRKEMRDENETVRVQRRNGRELRGNTLFVDLFCVDDSGGPITVRLDRFQWEPVGRRAAERLTPGVDVLMVRGRRVPNFNMVKVQRIRCLTNRALLETE